jgi:hypothetical protein
MSSSMLANDYDVGIGWTGMPLEMTVLALDDFAYVSLARDINHFSADILTAAAGKKVLAFGTYWTTAAMAALTAAAASVTVAIYEDATTKYDGTGARVVSLSQPLPELQAELALSWNVYGDVYLDMLRRSKTQAGGTGDEEYLKYGVDARVAVDGSTFVAYLVANRHLFSNGSDRSAFIQLGKAVVALESRRAAEAVAHNAIDVTLGGKRAVLIVGPFGPIQIYTDAITEHARATHADLAVNMRWDRSSGITRFSIVALTPGADAFKNAAPFAGNCGGKNVIGASFHGILLPVPQPGTELVTLIQTALDDDK